MKLIKSVKIYELAIASKKEHHSSALFQQLCRPQRTK